MKKMLCIFLATLLLVSFLVFPVSAEEYSGTCGDKATWTFDPNTGTLTYSGTGPIHGLPGDSSDGWRAYTSQIKHLVFEEGITAIEWGFERLMRMQTLKIADSVKTIGNMAFTECDDLHTLDLGRGVTQVGITAFSGAYSLVAVVLPDSLQNFAEGAFSHNSLKTLALPEGTTTINNGVFRYSEDLTTLYLPASLTKVDYAAFRGCSSLKDVYFGGTQAQWEAVEINNLNDDPYRGNNEYLLGATMHFAHSHSFGTAAVTRKATCAAEGIKTSLCTVCGGAKQQTYTAEHTWDSGKVTEASCTENGMTLYTCTVCNDTKQTPITATGHSWDKGTTNADTTVTYKCKTCTETKTEGTPVAPTEPTEPKPVVPKATEPTPTKPTEPTVEETVPETPEPTVPETTEPTVPETTPEERDPAPTVDATVPATDPVSEQNEPTQDPPKASLPWGIVVAAAVVVAGGAAAAVILLKKRKK